MPWKHGTPEERFWRYVARGPGDDDCHLWTGATKKGYGTLHLSTLEGSIYAHRMAWVLAHGRIPQGLLVCHHCDNPRCVRADHLFLGTIADNNHDMKVKGRAAKGDRNVRGRKTHCPHGHPYDTANTFRGSNGGRRCRICTRAYCADLRLRKRMKRSEQ